MNKKIYFKKGFFFSQIMYAFIMLLCALEIFIIIRSGKIDYLIFIQQIVAIFLIFVSLSLFIFAYQVFKLPFIVIKNDEIIQFIGIFRKKNKLKINDIRSFENDLHSISAAIKITLWNNKIKRLYLYKISKSDLEYIINLLRERIASLSSASKNEQ